MKPETTLAELDQQIERAKEILKLIDQEDTAMETGLSHGNHSHDYDDDDDDDYWDEEPSAANKASTTPRGSSQMDSIRAELYEALGRTEVMRSGGQNRDAARVWARKLAKIWKETGFWNDWQWIEREEDSTGDANKDWEELERPNVGEEHVEALVDRWEGEVL